MESEVWLERYAAEHGLEGGDDHQPDLDGSAEPDFRLTRGGSAAIVEVKEFESTYLDTTLKNVGPRNVVTTDPEQELETIRRKVRKGAEQLREYQDRGEALVVALANPNHLYVGFDNHDVQAAMHGDIGYVFAIDPRTGGAAEEGRFEHGRNGVLADRRRYVSGVLTLHQGSLAREAIERWHTEHRHLWEAVEKPRERMEAYLAARDEEALAVAGSTEGDFYFVRVYESKWVALGDAVPVPRDLFNGPRDEFWTVDLATGKPLRIHSVE
jgi:hypothetical protein